MSGDRLTATEALTELRAGRLTAEAMAHACLDRIAARDPQVRAWSHLDPDRVLAQARALDQGPRDLPLFGLPVGVKDVILTEDMPTRYNSRAYQDFHPRIDAACIKVLRAAGALILGKTDTVEFAATGRKAATTNPHDARRTPGGSSSGSAAAVADRHVPLALGTQTGGSIIRPASYCGTWAVKPTWGLVSNEGAKAFAPSLDTLGWFARSADDLALLYAVFDPDWRAPDPLDLRGARLAVCRTPAWDQAEPATRDALGSAVDLLSVAGAKVDPLELPAPLDGLPEAQVVVMRREARAVFLAEQRAHGLEGSLAEYVDNPWGYGHADLARAYDLAAEGRRVFDAVAAPYDAVIAPSSVGEAPLGLAETGSMAFNGMWTLLQTPCVNVPGLTGPSGLPVGVTVTGPRFADRKVLAAAAAVGALFAPG